MKEECKIINMPDYTIRAYNRRTAVKKHKVSMTVVLAYIVYYMIMATGCALVMLALFLLGKARHPYVPDDIKITASLIQSAVICTFIVYMRKLFFYHRYNARKKRRARR